MQKIIYIFLLSSCLIACKQHQVEESAVVEANEFNLELSQAQLKNINLKTGILERKSISSIIQVNGLIDVPPQNMVSISAPMGGYLKSTKLLEGMHISKGETIATLEDPQYIELQQNYLTGKAHLAALEKEYERQKALNESKASSDKVYEKSLADYLSQKILIKSLSEKLKLIHINPDGLNEGTISRTIHIPSPIDGFVSKVKMNIGRYISPTDVLFELVNPHDIHLALTIFEKDLNQLQLGQKIVAHAVNNPSRKYNCQIILIGKDISNERSVTVHCHFDKYDKTLIPGMYMSADIEVKSHEAYVIPNSGLVLYQNKSYVFIKEGEGKFKMQEVKTLANEDDYTQIELPKTVNTNQGNIVLDGAYTLLMALKNMEEED